MGETGPGMDKWGGRRERSGHWGQDKKRRPLVEDVLEYRDFYEGEGAN